MCNCHDTTAEEEAKTVWIDTEKHFSISGTQVVVLTLRVVGSGEWHNLYGWVTDSSHVMFVSRILPRGRFDAASLRAPDGTG